MAEISNAYDMPPLVSMIVSLGAGITASKVGCKYIIKDSSGKVIQEISEEVARNIDNTSNTTSIKENILKNVEESRIAREASGYKSFVEFESGVTEGATEAGEEMVTYRRVQGGTPPNVSWTRITVDESGNIKIPNKKANLNVST